MVLSFYLSSAVALNLSTKFYLGSDRMHITFHKSIIKHYHLFIYVLDIFCHLHSITVKYIFLFLKAL